MYASFYFLFHAKAYFNIYIADLSALQLILSYLADLFLDLSTL